MQHRFSLLAVEQAIDRMALALHTASSLDLPVDHRAMAEPAATNLALRAGPHAAPLGSWARSGTDLAPAGSVQAGPVQARPIPSGAPSLRERGPRSRIVHATAPGRGWWVLALGDNLDENDFAQREASRGRLRKAVSDAGVAPREYCWVWDRTGVAQLVLGTYADRPQAETQAVRFAGLGLRVRVTREFT
jgi:hypothetical protein